MSKKWIESEIDFLKNNWELKTNLELAQTLNRTEASIEHKLARLKCVNKNRNCAKNPEDVSWNRWFHSYKQRAKSQKFEFKLTKLEFRQLCSQNCVYDGSEPQLKNPAAYNNFSGHTTKIAFIKVNGIDRIDSSKGYTIDNCAPCCEICNKMKLDHTVDNFLEHIKKIHDFQKRKK